VLLSLASVPQPQTPQMRSPWHCIFITRSCSTLLARETRETHILDWNSAAPISLDWATRHDLGFSISSPCKGAA